MGDLGTGAGGPDGGGGPGPQDGVASDNLFSALVAVGKDTRDPATRNTSFSGIRNRIMAQLDKSQQLSAQKQESIVDGLAVVYAQGATNNSLKQLKQSFNGERNALGADGFTAVLSPANLQTQDDPQWLKNCPSIEITGLDPASTLIQNVELTLHGGKITYKVLTDHAVVADAMLFPVLSCKKSLKRRSEVSQKNLAAVLSEEDVLKKNIYALHTFILMRHGNNLFIIGTSKTQIGKTYCLFSHVSNDHDAAVQNEFKRNMFSDNFDSSNLLVSCLDTPNIRGRSRTAMRVTKSILWDAQARFSEITDNEEMKFEPGAVYVFVVYDKIGSYMRLNTYEQSNLNPNCRSILNSPEAHTPVVSMENVTFNESVTVRQYYFNVDNVRKEKYKTNCFPLTQFLEFLNSLRCIYNATGDQWKITENITKITSQFIVLSTGRSILQPFVSKDFGDSIMIEPTQDLDQQARQQEAQGKAVNPILSLLGAVVQARNDQCAPYNLLTVTCCMFVILFVKLQNFEKRVKILFHLGSRNPLPHTVTRQMHWRLFGDTLATKLRAKTIEINIFEFLYDILFYGILSSKTISVFDLVNSYISIHDACDRTTFTPVDENMHMKLFSLRYFMIHIITTLFRTVDILYGKHNRLPINWLRCKNATNRSSVFKDLCADVHKSNRSADKRFLNAVCPDYQINMTPTVILKYLAAISVFMKNDGPFVQDAFTHEIDNLTTNDAVNEARGLIERIVQFRDTSLTQDDENGRQLFVADANPEADEWAIPDEDLAFDATLPSGFCFPATFRVVPAAAAPHPPP